MIHPAYRKQICFEKIFCLKYLGKNVEVLNRLSEPMRIRERLRIPKGWTIMADTDAYYTISVFSSQDCTEFYLIFNMFCPMVLRLLVIFLPSSHKERLCPDRGNKINSLGYILESLQRGGGDSPEAIKLPNFV